MPHDSLLHHHLFLQLLKANGFVCFTAAEWREHPFWRLKQCPSHYADGTVSCCSCGRLQPLADEWASLQVCALCSMTPQLHICARVIISTKWSILQINCMCRGHVVAVMSYELLRVLWSLQ
jgi:hypothetical protein